MFTILLIMKILIISNSPIIIPFNNNLNKNYNNLREYLSLVQWNSFQADIYIGRPVQKVKNIGLFFGTSNNDAEKTIFIKNDIDEYGYDVSKSKTVNNYSYVIDVNNDIFIEYGIVEDSIYLGNRNYKEAEKIINFAQLNQSELYFPLNGMIIINNFPMFNIFEYFDSKKGVVINYDDYPHKYDLRYQEKDLENFIFNKIEIGNKIVSSIDKCIFSSGNTIRLNYFYSSYFSYLYLCSKIYFNNNNQYYYKCSENFDTSTIKINVGNMLLDENDLIIKIDKYIIPLILFGDFDVNVINLGSFYSKKFNIEKFNDGKLFELKRYKKKYNVNLPIISLERIPVSKNIILEEKSPDGNDIFPLRFLILIDKNNLENLDVNIIFKNINSEFKIEVYIVIEELIEALKNGILIEKFFEEKILFNKLHFVLPKDKILSKMIDEKKNYYIYIIIYKSQNDYKKYDSVESDIYINLILNKIIKPNQYISNIIGEENEVQLYFSKDSSEFNILKYSDIDENDEIYYLDKKRLFIHISLENSLDFAIINRSAFPSIDKIDYYKNSTSFETVEEYSDKIIIHKDIFNKSINDLMINIYTKENKRHYKNKGYKIKYFIGKIFEFPYYIVPEGKTINYENKIENNILNLNISIPNLEKYIYGIYMGFPNTTITIKIFELDINFYVDISRPITFYDYYEEIFSTNIFSKNDELTVKKIEGIKIDIDKKQYLIICFANITETNDTISYNSFLIKKKENELNDVNSLNITLIIVIIIITIILLIIIIYILYRKKILPKFSNKNRKNDVLINKEITLADISSH